MMLIFPREKNTRLQQFKSTPTTMFYNLFELKEEENGPGNERKTKVMDGREKGKILQ